MRGHEPILAMRRAGKRPAVVFVNDFPCLTDWDEFGDHATVCTHLDAIGMLDLRWAIGLTVTILADSEQRLRALADAFREAKAATVMGTAVDQRGGYWETTATEIEHA